MLGVLWRWFVETLRPERAVFLALGAVFGIGPRKVAGLDLWLGRRCWGTVIVALL